MIVAITGTPGSGKTYIAERIERVTKKGLERLDLNKYIRDNKIYSSYDKSAKTYDVDTKLLKKKISPILKKLHSKNKTLDKLVEKKLNLKKPIKLKELTGILSKDKNIKGIIVDSHLSHYVECDYCIVVRSDIKKIYKRLKVRKYPKKKIEDNIQSEIFEICLDEARSAKHNIILVDN